MDSGVSGYDLLLPLRAGQAGEIEKIRSAQEAGKLDLSWDPADICALVSQIATAWIGLPEVASLAGQLPPNAPSPTGALPSCAAFRRSFPLRAAGYQTILLR